MTDPRLVTRSVRRTPPALSSRVRRFSHSEYADAASLRRRPGETSSPGALDQMRAEAVAAFKESMA